MRQLTARQTGQTAIVRVLGVLLAVGLCSAGAGQEAPPSRVSFNRDVRAILSDNCFQCHGPDAKTREADLRLDVRDDAVDERDEGPAIVPGDPAKSVAMLRIQESDESLRMPPAETEKQLTSEQIDTLRRWIQEGAEYEQHWAFTKISNDSPPMVRSVAMVRNGIDRFVLQRLEAKGLSLSREADRATLIRRVHLDLLGTLPSVAAVEAFESDTRPDAYERLVDEVLASPRFGERWGRHWLDQARYADSHGYTNDNERVMWPYRDWVIQAFNRDLPFDRFTIQQLAGDLLPDATLDQLVATGFHRNTLINTEGGTKADQFRDEQVKDRVDTTGAVWLGLTVGCAKCHTHKYDPISQAEYYSLYAFFNSTQDNNSISPTIKVPSYEQQLRLDELTGRRSDLEAFLAKDDGRKERQAEWERGLLEEAEAKGQSTTGEDFNWTILDLDGKSTKGVVFKKLEDGSVLATGDNAAGDEYQFTVRSPLTKIRSMRLEAIKHDSLPKKGPGRATNGNFVLSEIFFRTGDGQLLRFQRAYADHSQPKYDVADSIDGKPDTGWAINGAPEGGPNHNRVAWFVLPKTLEIEKEHALTFKLQFNNGSSPYNMGRLRISLSPDVWVEKTSAAALAKLAQIDVAKRTVAQKKKLDQAFLQQDEKLSSAHGNLQVVIKDLDKVNAEVASSMVLRELAKARPTFVQTRGDFLRTEDEVVGGVPAALPQIAESPDQRNRLQFAKWLTQADNPLTARVRVNRIWMRMFGRGLVETENDFGSQGAMPSHPGLLDWLSREYIRREWSTKSLIRLIACSSAYRQSSVRNPIAEKVDPRNLLLARQNRVRVEGEIVRDIGLAVSGLLSAKIGGPSVYPPQPAGVYAFTQRKKNWRTSQGEDRYRRGMYTFFYRSAPYPMLTTFDAPKFNQTCTRRDRSNTPLQSLTLANAEAMHEMTRRFALNLLRDPSLTTDEARIRSAFRRCFSRAPDAPELEYLSNYLASERKRFSAHPDAAKQVASDAMNEVEVEAIDMAAWVSATRVLFNLDEFVTRE